MLGGAADEEPQEPPRKKAKPNKKPEPPSRSAVAPLFRVLAKERSITEATSAAFSPVELCELELEKFDA